MPFVYSDKLKFAKLCKLQCKCEFGIFRVGTLLGGIALDPYALPVQCQYILAQREPQSRAGFFAVAGFVGFKKPVKYVAQILPVDSGAEIAD